MLAVSYKMRIFCLKTEDRLHLGTFLDVKNISMCLFRRAEQNKK